MKTKSKLLYVKPLNGYDIKVYKRNERERKRVKCVNNVYEKLKQHIPDVAKVKKMSKFNIIMNAVKYIQLLTSILNEDTHNNQYSAEQLCQSSRDQSIIDNKFNDDISQSVCQESNSLDYFQYNNTCFQDVQNVIREDYNQWFGNFNQEIDRENYNQYIDVLYEHDYNQ